MKTELTTQMLKAKLTEHYSLGWEDFFQFLGGVLLLMMGVPFVAAIFGIVLIAIGLWMWWKLLKKILKKRSRMEKILQGRFALYSRTIWSKKIEPGDSYSDETYWACLDGDDAVQIEKGEYPFVESGDMLWQLKLEGETEVSANYIEKLCEPDEEVKAMIR